MHRLWYNISGDPVEIILFRAKQPARVLTILNSNHWITGSGSLLIILTQNRQIIILLSKWKRVCDLRLCLAPMQ